MFCRLVTVPLGLLDTRLLLLLVLSSGVENVALNYVRLFVQRVCWCFFGGGWWVCGCDGWVGAIKHTAIHKFVYFDARMLFAHCERMGL